MEEVTGTLSGSLQAAPWTQDWTLGLWGQQVQQDQDEYVTRAQKKKKPKKKNKKKKKKADDGGDDGGDAGGDAGGGGDGGGKTTGISIFNDSVFADGKYSGKQNSQNIVAVHEKDWKKYKGKTVRINYKGKSVDAVVADYCAVKDDKACNSNMRGGFLLDLHTNVAKKLGLSGNKGVDSATFQVV